MNTPTEHLFAIEAAVPDPVDAVPVYRTTRFRTFSRGAELVRRDFDRRVRRFTRLFAVDAEPRDLGDRMVCRDEHAALEIFLPSDSVWWTDRQLARSEDRRLSRGLPSAARARKTADQMIERLGITREPLVFNAVTDIRASLSTSRKARPRSYRTGVVVDFRFELHSLPVFGPGAKFQVAMADEDRVSEVLLFWRRARKAGTVRVLHPYRAIERLTSDPRFRHLSSGASVRIQEIELGYYAAPPSAFQRYLIPVYRMRGRVHTPVLENYDLQTYVAAVDIPPDELKHRGLRARATFRPVFTSL